jgi:hypothetical protein
VAKKHTTVEKEVGGAVPSNKHDFLEKAGVSYLGLKETTTIDRLALQGPVKWGVLCFS